MPLQHFLDRSLQPLDRLFRGEAKIESCLQFAGNDIGGARAGRNVRYLKSGGLEVPVAVIPHAGREFRQGGRRGMDWVIANCG